MQILLAFGVFAGKGHQQDFGIEREEEVYIRVVAIVVLDCHGLRLAPAIAGSFAAQQHVVARHSILDENDLRAIRAHAANGVRMFAVDHGTGIGRRAPVAIGLQRRRPDILDVLLPADIVGMISTTEEQRPPIAGDEGLTSAKTLLMIGSSTVKCTRRRLLGFRVERISARTSRRGGRVRTQKIEQEHNPENNQTSQRNSAAHQPYRFHRDFL